MTQSVLIVDDDEELRDVMQIFFKKMNYAVHAAANAESARKWLSSNSPNLILLDIMMPDGNGLDLCRWIRSQPKFREVPVLVASAIEDEETVQDALEMGAADFIHKPYKLELLKEKVQRIQTRQE